MSGSVRSHLSPTRVLLAFDWLDARPRPDFLGFAIKRTPGFRSRPQLALAPDASWAKKYYLAGSPEAKARIALATPVPVN